MNDIDITLCFNEHRLYALADVLSSLAGKEICLDENEAPVMHM